MNSRAKFDKPRRSRSFTFPAAPVFSPGNAGGLDDAAAMFLDLRVAEFAPDRFQRGERAFVVLGAQPRVPGNICRQDRRQTPLDAFCGHNVLLPNNR